MTKEVLAIIAIIIGLLISFAGYKIQKALITIVWFCIGYLLATNILSNYIAIKNTIIIISIVVGIIFGSIGFKLERFALFISISYLTYKNIGGYITGLDNNLIFMIEGAISLIVGGLSILFIKPILIFITGITGPNIIKYYLPTLVSLSSNIILIIGIVIAILGIITQIKTNH